MSESYRESPGVQAHEVGDDDCSVRTESHVTEDKHCLVSAHLLTWTVNNTRSKQNESD